MADNDNDKYSKNVDDNDTIYTDIDSTDAELMMMMIAMKVSLTTGLPLSTTKNEYKED